MFRMLVAASVQEILDETWWALLLIKVLHFSCEVCDGLSQVNPAFHMGKADLHLIIHNFRNSEHKDSVFTICVFEKG